LKNVYEHTLTNSRTSRNEYSKKEEAGFFYKYKTRMKAEGGGGGGVKRGVKGRQKFLHF